LALSGPFYEGLLYAAHNNRFERFTVFRPPALPEVGDLTSQPLLLDMVTSGVIYDLLFPMLEI
jgi:hypothetical protein